MIVVDTSVFIDLLAPRDPNRHELAKKLFSLVERRGITIYAPRLMVEGARDYGIEAYYLIEEHEELYDRLS